MKEIKTMVDYWESLTLIDRISFLSEYYFSTDLADRKFSGLPPHIRSSLYSLFNHKLRYTLDRDIEF